MNKTITIWMAFFMMLGCSSGKDEAALIGQIEGVEVKVVETAKEAISKELVYSGLLEPEVDVPLSFSLPGTIVHVTVKEGATVKKGEVLAQLDKTSYQSAYESAVATQQQAQDAYNRLKIVHDKGSLPDIDWEDIKAKLSQANAAEAIAKKNLENTEIRAPFSGVIGARNVEPGANAVPGLMAFRLITFNNVYARISVPEDEINHINRNQAAVVQVPAIGQTLFGEVDQVGVIAHTISKTFEVKVLLNNAEMTMRPGMVSDVHIPLETNETALLVPLKSVMKQSGSATYVYVLQGDEVEKRKVEVGGIINNKMKITAGLKLGELVVIEGQQKLSPNTKVLVQREVASLQN